MRKQSLLLFASIAGFAASPTEACRIYMPSADLSVIHRELPRPLPSELFVAEIQIERPDAGWAELREGTRARIRRIIQGDYSGDVLIIRDGAEIRVTCYAPVRYGGAGIVLGTPVGVENGHMVLEPVFEGPTERR
jgi:hypothetical protein